MYLNEMLHPRLIASPLNWRLTLDVFKYKYGLTEEQIKAIED